MKEQIIKELENKSVLILGFGREGKSTYRFIKENNIKCKVAIADKNEIDYTGINIDDNITLHIGDDYLESIYDYDIVMKSPGISFKGRDFLRDDIKITSQTELFLKYASEKVIGITGTKGKSTTSSLIYSMLSCKYKVVLVGNIGRPVFEEIDSYESVDFYVYELSSHQLENCCYSPRIAVLLNMYEEHLDHYDSYEAYKEAKRNIFKHQSEKDYYVYNCDMKYVLNENIKLNQNVIEITNNENNNINGKNQIVYNQKEIYFNFKNEDCKIGIPINENIRGIHNIYNIAVAVAVSKLLSVKDEDIVNCIKNFKTLPHRLENMGEFNGVTYIDDSIATIPEATISAIKSIDNVDTVLIGGMDRGINYGSLIEYISKEFNHNVILMYDSGKKIYSELQKTKCASNINYVKNLEEAVKLATEITQKGKTCILTPAAASYGIFKNFEERGDKFKELVKKYTNI